MARTASTPVIEHGFNDRLDDGVNLRSREAAPEPRFDAIGGTFLGGAGDDEIHGGQFGDLIIGNASPNPFIPDADTLFGEEGWDTIYGNAGDDSIFGGADEDTLFGQSGNDFIDGGTGDDMIEGGSGADEILGGDGEDWINGDGLGVTSGRGSYDDIIHGGDAEDWIFGMHGDDTLNGDGGDDRLFGDHYDAVGDDLLNGGDGDDRLWGGDGDDTLNGGSDEDYLHGGDGDDTLDGGDGLDMLIGGAGADLYRAGTDGIADVVTGYSFAEGDRIVGDHYLQTGDGTNPWTYVFDANGTALFILPNYGADTDGILLVAG